MNVLLIGGPGSLTNHMIVKLKKEGHRVSLLTGESYARKGYEKVFETYTFTYDSDSLKEIFDIFSFPRKMYMVFLQNNQCKKQSN